jgi:hypothetical protein
MRRVQNFILRLVSTGFLKLAEGTFLEYFFRPEPKGPSKIILPKLKQFFWRGMNFKNLDNCL